MRYIKIIALICACFVIFITCKKNKDVVSTHEIKGEVFNNCTDSNMAGIKIYFSDNKSIALETISDANGDFIFKDVKLHSSKDYKYKLSVPSISGIGANNPSLSIFDGTDEYFNKEELLNFINSNDKIKLKVTPGFYHFCYTITNTDTIKSPDSLSLYFEQKILKKNLPNSTFYSPVYSINKKGPMFTNLNPLKGCSFCPYYICMNTSWMGMWYVYIEKKKGGIYTYTKDSVYLVYQATNSITINW